MAAGHSRLDLCFPLQTPPPSAHVDKEQRPRQKAKSFAAGVVPTTWGTCLHAFNLLTHMPYAIIGITHVICTSYLWIYICIYICSDGGQGMLHCYQPLPFTFCSHLGSGSTGNEEKKTCFCHFWRMCYDILKTGNKHSHLHCSDKWMKSVKLPASSCASLLPFPFLRIYFVRKIHANVRNQG